MEQNKVILTHEEIEALKISKAHKDSLHRRLDEYNSMTLTQRTGIIGLDAEVCKPHQVLRG